MGHCAGRDGAARTRRPAVAALVHPWTAAALAGALLFHPVGALAAGAAAAAPAWTRAAPVRPWTATVRGEFNRPGTYAIEPGDRLSSLVAKAGGFTDAASLRAAALARKAAAKSQAEELREIVRRIEAEAHPAGDPRTRDERERFLAALGALSPAGRIPVRLSHPRLMRGSVDDILLEDGDVLTVPSDPGTVAVAGAVRSPGAYPARQDARLRDYIRAAGGVTGDANTKKAWLLAADGRAVPLARPFVAWDPANARWELTVFRGDPVPAAAGDTIVVPRKAAGIAWLEGIPDIDALVVRIAVVAGKVVVP